MYRFLLGCSATALLCLLLACTSSDPLNYVSKPLEERSFAKAGGTDVVVRVTTNITFDGDVSMGETSSIVSIENPEIKETGASSASMESSSDSSSWSAISSVSASTSSATLETGPLPTSSEPLKVVDPEPSDPSPSISIAPTIPMRVGVSAGSSTEEVGTTDPEPIVIPALPITPIPDIKPAVTPPTPEPAPALEPAPKPEPAPETPAKSATPPSTTSTTAASAPSTMKTFAEKDGQTVTEYTLTNASGAELKVLDYGCIVTSLKVPNRDGELVDIALGHDNLTSYEEDSPYFGAMVGRNGNRIANATFKLGDETYKLAANNGDHNLHGGEKGFDKVIWKANPVGTQKIEFNYDSKDGEEGFPGNLGAKVTYELTDDNEFKILVRATSDAPTICNIVHHSYWNLEGHDAGKIYDHELQLYAANYTPADDTLIPTGKIAPVEGTPLDFRSPKRIGKDLQAVGGDPVGYDHNLVVDGGKRKLRPVAKVSAPKSGIVMEIESNQPGVQFYTGNFMNGHSGKNGADYQQHEGFCLETQFYPDSANKQGVERWPSAVLRPGDTYVHRMNHKFSVAK